MITPIEFRRRLLSCGIANDIDIIGCTASEIDLLQDFLSLKFPSVYIDFLRIAGKSAGKFMRDVDMFYDQLFNLNSQAAEKLSDWEGDTLNLPNNSMVFGIRQLEQFMFFIADGKQDNPEIFFYYEGSGSFKRIAESFWDVIEAELMHIEDFKRQHPDSFYFK